MRPECVSYLLVTPGGSAFDRGQMNRMPLRLVVNYGKPFLLELQQDRAVPVIEAARSGLCTLRWRAAVTICMFSPSASDQGSAMGCTFIIAASPHNSRRLISQTPWWSFPKCCRSSCRYRLGRASFGRVTPSRTADCALVAPWAWAMELGRGAQNARLYSMALLQEYVDRVVVGAQWHARYISETLSISSRGFTVTYLGVPLECYQGPAPARHRYRLVYTSQARRGMGPLLLNPWSVAIRPWFAGNPSNGNWQQPGTKNHRVKKPNNATDK